MINRVLKKIGLDDTPFILAVGTLEPRKNLQGLLSGYKLSGLANNYRLVVVGAKGWKTEGIFRRLTKLGVADSVVFTGFLSDEELCVLYRSATLLCYPSFDEGFGLPVLEAMACGCPVVASKIPAIEEVGNDVLLYVDPQNDYSIASALKRMVKDKPLRESMVTKGKQRAQEFSWNKVALEVTRVINRTIGS